MAISETVVRKSTLTGNHSSKHCLAVCTDPGSPLEVTTIGGANNDDLISTTPEIYNVVSPGTASTEFSQALNANTKGVMIRCRGRANLQFTFTSGESGTKFITIRANGVYTAKDLKLASATLYMQVDKPSITVEILEWT